MSESIGAIGAGLGTVSGINSGAAIGSAKDLGIVPEEKSSFEKFFTGAYQTMTGTFPLASQLLTGGSGYESAAIPTELLGLLEAQRQMQIQMESVSLISNIEKSKHESKMAAIRNIRTS